MRYLQNKYIPPFRETRPATTVAFWEDGEIKLKVIDDKELNYWLEKYTLGELFRSGELESME